MSIERKLAAIMFTDIAGYTALSAKDENKALELLDKQKQILTPIIEEYNGILHNKGGDSLLFTFSTVTDAVKCGIKIQKQIKAVENFNLRIGIHEGEITHKDGDVLGDDVNIASRIEPFSTVGGIAISGKVQQNISSLPEFKTTYVGTPKLKGVAQKVEIYCITSHGLPKTDVSKVSAKLEDKSRFNIYTLTGGILTAIGISFWIAVGIFDVSLGDETEVPSIAILPFDNKGADEDEFYAYGISSELISDIAGAGLIRVASLKDIEKLDYTTLDNSGLSEKLLVRYIAQGTLWKVDSVFQLSIELYDTKTSKIMWSDSWQKEWNDLSSIKSNLAENILQSLKVSTKQGIPQVSTSNPEAYEYYLKGKYKYEKRGNMEDTEIALGLLQKAIQLDDNLIVAKDLTGWIYTGQGDCEKALKILKPALKQAENLGKKYGLGFVLNGVGQVYECKEDLDSALFYYIRSIDIREEIDDKRGVGATLHNIGSVYYDKGNYEKALDYYTRSFGIKEELGDMNGIGTNLVAIGAIYRDKGELDIALEYYDRSLKIFKEFSSKYGIGMTLYHIGSVYYGKGNYDKALDYYTRSFEIKEELGDTWGMGNLLYNIGFVYFNNDDYDKALGYYLRSLEKFEELGDKSWMGEILTNIGSIYSYIGDYIKALDYYERSLKINKELGDKNEIGLILFDIGDVYHNEGDYERAVEYLENALANDKEIGLGADELIWSTTYLYLTYKNLGKAYDEKEIHHLIKGAENIEYDLNYALFELLESTSYLETAYNQIQEKASAMEEELKAKFLSYPIPKAIVEEWEKVNP